LPGIDSEPGRERLEEDIYEMKEHVYEGVELHIGVSDLTRKAPSRFLCQLGLLPAPIASVLMMGMKMPPALAVEDGSAGATIASASVRP